MSEVGSLIVNVLLALPPFPSPESSPLLFLTLPYNKRMEINLCGISTGCGLLFMASMLQHARMKCWWSSDTWSNQTPSVRVSAGDMTRFKKKGGKVTSMHVAIYICSSL